MFQSAFASFFTPARSPLSAALPGDVFIPELGPRARHAQALAYAAQRRRAALACQGGSGADGAYWKAGVPAAIARAQALRAGPCFARLP